MGDARLQRTYLYYLNQGNPEASARAIDGLGRRIDEDTERTSSWLTNSEVMVDKLLDFEAKRLAESGKTDFKFEREGLAAMAVMCDRYPEDSDDSFFARVDETIHADEDKVTEWLQILAKLGETFPELNFAEKQGHEIRQFTKIRPGHSQSPAGEVSAALAGRLMQEPRIVSRRSPEGVTVVENQEELEARNRWLLWYTYTKTLAERFPVVLGEALIGIGFLPYQVEVDRDTEPSAQVTAPLNDTDGDVVKVQTTEGRLAKLGVIARIAIVFAILWILGILIFAGLEYYRVGQAKLDPVRVRYAHPLVGENTYESRSFFFVYLLEPAWMSAPLVEELPGTSTDQQMKELESKNAPGFTPIEDVVGHENLTVQIRPRLGRLSLVALGLPVIFWLFATSGAKAYRWVFPITEDRSSSTELADSKLYGSHESNSASRVEPGKEGKKKALILIVLPLLLGVGSFAYLVWPTPYRYFKLNDTTVREHRFTGQTEVLRLSGWKTYEPK